MHSSEGGEDVSPSRPPINNAVEQDALTRLSLQPLCFSLQIQRIQNSTLNPDHRSFWNLAEFAVKSHNRKRTDTLYICD